jgi:hypothetical protein
MPRRACLIFLGIACWTGTALGQVELKWRLKTGDTFYLETATTRKQTVRFMGQDTKTDQQYVTVSKYLVARANDDGSLVLEQKFLSVKPKTEGAADAMPAVLNKLLESSFQIHLSPTMQVTKIEGYDDFVKLLGAGNAGYERVARALASEEMLRRAVEESMGFLKAGPLQRDERWTKKFDVPLGPLGNVAMTRNYTYAGPEKLGDKELHKVTVATEATYAISTAETGILPFRITQGEIKVLDGTGTIWFDAAAGRLVQSRSNQKLKGSLTVRLMDQDQVVEIDQEQTVELRVLDRNPADAVAGSKP